MQKRVPVTPVSLRVVERSRFEVRGCLRFGRVLVRESRGRDGRNSSLSTGDLRVDRPMSTSFTRVVSISSRLRFEIVSSLVTARTTTLAL